MIVIMDPSHDLTASLLARCRNDLEAMRGAAARGDAPTIERLAHRMVGAAGALGLEPIAECARTVSRAARAGSAEPLAPLLDRLAACLEAAP